MIKMLLLTILLSFNAKAQTESSEPVAPVNIVKVDMISVPAEPKSKFDSEIALKLIEKKCSNLDKVIVSGEKTSSGVLSAFELKCQNGKEGLVINVNLVIKKVDFWDKHGELFSLIAENDESIINVINKLITVRSDLKNFINDLKTKETESRIDKLLK